MKMPFVVEFLDNVMWTTVGAVVIAYPISESVVIAPIIAGGYYAVSLSLRRLTAWVGSLASRS